jgi:hypothetical protein
MMLLMIIILQINRGLDPRIKSTIKIMSRKERSGTGLAVATSPISA